MNALKAKFFTVAIAAGLTATAAFAASDSVIVTFPQPVTVGNVTLPSGQYQVKESSLSDGNWFVFRSAKGEAVASSLASKSAGAAPDQKTEVVLSTGNGALHVDKIFIEGEASGYQFPESK